MTQACLECWCEGDSGESVKNTYNYGILKSVELLSWWIWVGFCSITFGTCRVVQMDPMHRNPLYIGGHVTALCRQPNLVAAREVARFHDWPIAKIFGHTPCVAAFKC